MTDQLFRCRQLFHIGAYQQVLHELSEVRQASLDRDVLSIRARLLLGDVGTLVEELGSKPVTSDAEDVTRRALHLTAIHFDANTRFPLPQPNEKESAAYEKVATRFATELDSLFNRLPAASDDVSWDLPRVTVASLLLTVGDYTRANTSLKDVHSPSLDRYAPDEVVSK